VNPIARIPLPPGMLGSLYASGLPGSAAGVPVDRLPEELRARAVDRVVCLCPDDELFDRSPAYYGCLARDELGVAVDRFPVADWAPPADPGAYLGLVRETATRLRMGERVLVHCNGGCGRTGTFCCCVLVALGATPEEAEIAFRAARRCGPENDEQRRFVELAAIRLGPVS
jgi:Cyclin-dependent kinase inhibitor 3 (CDKN3)